MKPATSSKEEEAPYTPGGRDKAAPTVPVCDLEVAYEQAGLDQDLLLEIIEMFHEESPRTLAEIETAFARRDADALERAAHKLKGASGAIAARRTYAAAFRMEVAGQTANFAEAAAILDELEAEIVLLRAVLTAYQEAHR